VAGGEVSREFDRTIIIISCSGQRGRFAALFAVQARAAKTLSVRRSKAVRPEISIEIVFGKPHGFASLCF